MATKQIYAPLDRSKRRIYRPSQVLTFFFVGVLCASSVTASPGKKCKDQEKSEESTRNLPAVLWQEPADIASRDLYYGPGGKQHAPRGTTFTFAKEDLNGSNPKFTVHDEAGVKWK